MKRPSNRLERRDGWRKWLAEWGSAVIPLTLLLAALGLLLTLLLGNIWP